MKQITNSFQQSHSIEEIPIMWVPQFPPVHAFNQTLQFVPQSNFLPSYPSGSVIFLQTPQQQQQQGFLCPPSMTGYQLNTFSQQPNNILDFNQQSIYLSQQQYEQQQQPHILKQNTDLSNNHSNIKQNLILPSNLCSPSKTSEINPMKILSLQEDFLMNPESAIEEEIPLNNSESIKTKEKLSQQIQVVSQSEFDDDDEQLQNNNHNTASGSIKQETVNILLSSDEPSNEDLLSKVQNNEYPERCFFRTLSSSEQESKNLLTQLTQPTQVSYNPTSSLSHDNLQHLMTSLISGQTHTIQEISSVCNLQNAFSIVQSSQFNIQNDLLFSDKYTELFQFKEGISDNSEVVFSQIKQSRRNNRNIHAKNYLFDGINNCKDAAHNKSLKTKKIAKPTSKFHNLKKLFMYKVIASFSMSNLVELGVDEQISGILIDAINQIKISAKKSKEFNRNTEFFSQAHYNALFLFLNPKTIAQLAKNKFEVHLHKLLFQIDLVKINEVLQRRNTKNSSQANTKDNKITSANTTIISNELSYEEIQSKLQFTNIVKRYCFQVVSATNMLRTTNENQTEQENMRMAYTSRAIQGIGSLNKGLLVKKF